MKAISLHQPWASLIVHGYKTIETRSWAPPKTLIGERIAIHAARKTVSIKDIPEVWQPLVRMYKNFGQPGVPQGAVVATARLVDAWQVRDTSKNMGIVHPDGYPQVFGDSTLESQRRSCKADPYGDFSVGRWLWFLEDVELVDPPVPVRGHQGFWNWDE